MAPVDGERSPGLAGAARAIAAAVLALSSTAAAQELEARALEELRERELISSAYLERNLEIDLHDGRRVTAVVYVINPDHVQYCGGLPLEEQAQIIARAVGGRGPNTEYLYNTARHLTEIGLHDPDLEWLSHRVQALST